MIELVDKSNGTVVGSLDEAQATFLTEFLEEESADDTDYYFNAATIDALEDFGADEALVTLLRSALGSRSEMELDLRPV